MARPRTELPKRQRIEVEDPNFIIDSDNRTNVTVKVHFPAIMGKDLEQVVRETQNGNNIKLNIVDSGELHVHASFVPTHEVKELNEFAMFVHSTAEIIAHKVCFHHIYTDLDEALSKRLDNINLDAERVIYKEHE